MPKFKRSPLSFLPMPVRPGHFLQERAARDLMIASLNLGLPYPLRDLEVDYERAVGYESQGKIFIHPAQSEVGYEVRNSHGAPVAGAGQTPPVFERMADRDGVTLLTAPITEDAGFRVRAARNWTESHLREIFMLDQRKGWIVGDATILYTETGGYHWHTQASADIIRDSLRAVYFLADGLTGWAVGPSRVLYTRDGGSSWKEQYTLPGANFHSICFINKKQGWIAGEQISLYTDNGGDRWEEKAFQLSETETLSSQKAVNAMQCKGNTGFAVGKGGLILMKTIDGGGHWEEKSPLGVDQDLKAIHLHNENQAWVVGASGIILSTEDGGENWTRQSSNTEVTLSAVHFIDASHGWVCGEMGIIRSTSDGGSNWTTESSGLSPNLEAMQFVRVGSTVAGYLVGADGMILQAIFKEGSEGSLAPALAVGTHWRPSQLMVLLHQEVAVRLTPIDTTTPISFSEREEAKLETIVDYNSQASIYIHRSQQDIVYQLVSRKKTNAEPTLSLGEIWSLPAVGNGDKIALELKPDRSFTEDLELWVRASYAEDRLETQARYMNKSLQVYVRPDPSSPQLQLAPNPLEHNRSNGVLTIDSTQSSVEYAVYYIYTTKVPFDPDQPPGDQRSVVRPLELKRRSNNKLRQGQNEVEALKEGLLIYTWASKKTGKGGSLWLDSHLEVLVYPDTSSPALRVTPFFVGRGESAQIQVYNAQPGTTYQLDQLPDQELPPGPLWEEDWSRIINVDIWFRLVQSVYNSKLGPFIYPQPPVPKAPPVTLSVPILPASTTFDVLATRDVSSTQKALDSSIRVKVGYLEFDGKETHAVAHSSKGIRGGLARTVEVWIRPEKAGGTIVVWGEKYDTNPGSRWLLGVTPYNNKVASEKGCLLFLDIGNAILLGKTNLSDGHWHHIVCTLTPRRANPTLEDVSLFVDASLESTFISQRANNVVINTAEELSLTFGFDPGLKYSYFHGCMAEARIWRRAFHLTDDEFSILGIGESRSAPPALIGYWRFNDGNGNIAADIGNRLKVTVSKPIWH